MKDYFFLPYYFLGRINDTFSQEKERAIQYNAAGLLPLGSRDSRVRCSSYFMEISEVQGIK